MNTKIIELSEVDSTNEYCKRYNGEGDIIVTAARQTMGKGTKGRSFLSDEGGLYISYMRNMLGFDSANAFSIMINSCVAVCRTLEEFSFSPVIRWANDVLICGKKICGTLIENTLGSGGRCKSIVGIGLNVNNILPCELRGIAITMSEAAGRAFDVKEVCSVLVKNWRKEYSVDEYKSYINWFGRKVTLNESGVLTEAFALDVDSKGNLICDVGGSVRRISSAEISLRI